MMKCPECGTALRKFVMIIIDCSAEHRAFDTDALLKLFKAYDAEVVASSLEMLHCVECGWCAGKSPTLKSSEPT